MSAHGGRGRTAVAVVSGHFVGDGGQQLVDADGEGVYLSAQGVDLVEQHPGDLAMVVVEPAGQRFGQGGAFGLHPAAG
jgi:hypothetical protein